MILVVFSNFYDSVILWFAEAETLGGLWEEVKGQLKGKCWRSI